MADSENLAGKILKGMNSFVDKFQWDGESILRSNEPINKIGKFIMGEADTGIRGTLAQLAKNEEGMTFKKALDEAYHVGEGEAKHLNYKAIAGTYIGASLAGRVITGGGIYRDRNGNVNVPGVPFI